MPVPVGYVGPRDTASMIDPATGGAQEVIRTIFSLFDRLGSGRQVLMQMRKDGLLPSRGPPNSKQVDHVNLASAVLPGTSSASSRIRSTRGPTYTGSLARADYDRRWRCLRSVYGRLNARDQWTALLREHHEGYISGSSTRRTRSGWHGTLSRNPPGLPMRLAVAKR